VQGSQPTLRFRNMNQDNSKLTTAMFRSLGRALGMKRGAVIVDSCIADLYESCLPRVAIHSLLVGNSQIDWLHEWIGSLVVAREVSGIWKLNYNRILA
jgi:hypothetical protein